MKLAVFNPVVVLTVVRSLGCVPLFVAPWTAARPVPILCCLPEFAQTHVHGVSDAVQPSHPLSSPSPSALNLSEHQGLLQKVTLCIRWPE